MRRFGWSWDVSDGSFGGVSSGGLLRVFINGNVKPMLVAGILRRGQAERWDGLYRVHFRRLPRKVREVRGIRYRRQLCIDLNAYHQRCIASVRGMDFVFSESRSAIVSSDEVTACIVWTSCRGARSVMALSYRNGRNV